MTLQEAIDNLQVCMAGCPQCIERNEAIREALKRPPVPLRCTGCEEIIYQDEPWSEYGADWESSDAPYHCACYAAYMNREYDQADNKYIEDLKQRPWESLDAHEQNMLAIYRSHEALINFIVKNEKI